MQLTVVGLNHQTAPLSIREKLAFAAANLPDAVSNLARSEAAEEAVILSTCNRTELYCVGESEKIINWLAKYHNLPVEEIRPYLYTLDNNETVRHAFRVACGLDSMVLGEPQILGQIKDAVRVATTKPQRKLFFNLRSMRKNLNALSPKEAQEIADDLGVKLSEVLEMEQRMTGHDIGIMAENNDDEDNFAPIDWLADHDAEPSRQLSKQAHYALQTEGLQNALAQLDDRSRRIVESRWLQDDGGLTLHELAAEYGVSAERIRQIEAKAMQKLRGFLAEEAEAV